MGFINPYLWWGLLGISIPIIIHLLYRQRYKRIRWAAMEFLLEAIKRTRRRIRLENLILLLIRCAVMALIALAVMKPFVEETIASTFGQSDIHYIIVLDNSYSMNYKIGQISSLDRAKKFTDVLLDKIKCEQGDNVSIILMNSYPSVLVDATKNKDLIKSEIAELRPSDLGTSLLRTAEYIKAEIGKNKNFTWRIYIITDMTRVGWEAKDKEGERLGKLLEEISTSPKKDRQVFLVDVGPEKETENLAITSIKLESKLVTTKRPTEFQVEIANFTNQTKSDYAISLFVEDEKIAKDRRKVVLPGNTVTRVPFRYEFSDSGPCKVFVELQGDNLTTDDRRFLSLDVKDSARILAINGQPKLMERSFDETYFYKIALNPTDFPSPFSVEERTEYELSGFPEKINQSDLVVLANVKTLSNLVIERLESYVKNGGGLFITLGDNISRRDYNELLYKGGKGLLPAELIEVGGDERKIIPVALTEIDYSHRIFNFFERRDFRAFLTDVPIWQFYKTKVDPKDKDVKVLARYNNPDGYHPAFIEKKFGEGKVLMFTSTLDMDWHSMVPVVSYVPLMHLIAYYLISKPQANKNISVWEPIEIILDFEQLAGGYRLMYPDGTPKMLKHEIIGTDVGQKVKILPELAERAGIYRICSVGAEPEKKPITYFAANVDTEESNLERISVDEIRQKFKNFSFEFISGTQEKEEIKIEAPKRGIWKSLLYALLGFLALESILAWLFGRGKA
jgi:hypothetical protein